MTKRTAVQAAMLLASPPAANGSLQSEPLENAELAAQPGELTREDQRTDDYQQSATRQFDRAIESAKANEETGEVA